MTQVKTKEQEAQEYAKTKRIFEPKYGGKDHSGYETLMKYEVNDYLEETAESSFLSGILCGQQRITADLMKECPYQQYEQVAEVGVFIDGQDGITYHDVSKDEPTLIEIGAVLSSRLRIKKLESEVSTLKARNKLLKEQRNALLSRLLLGPIPQNESDKTKTVFDAEVAQLAEKEKGI